MMQQAFLVILILVAVLEILECRRYGNNFRGDSEAATGAKNLLQFKHGLQNLDLTPTLKSDNTRVATPVFLRRSDD